MIHFFTDYGRLNPQTAGQAYGPINDNEYRVTSLHQLNDNANAYAICDGQLLAVESEIQGKLNLILRPADQGILKFTKIKFIIYRGVERDSLLNNEEIANKDNNSITGYLWKQFKKKDNDPNPKKERLLVNESLDEWLEVSFLNGKVGPIPMKPGDTLGKFKSGTEFGIEVIIDHDITLEEARSSKTIIKFTQSDNPLKNKSIREKILGYLDPTIFFSMHFDVGVKCKESLREEKFTKLTNDRLFNSVIQKFYSPDVVYIDIRNEQGYSMDYFRQYEQKIQISLPNTPDQLNFTELRFVWPIVQISKNRTPAFFVPEGSDSIIVLRSKALIGLQFPKGNNESPLVYVAEGSFFGDPNPPQGQERFQNPGLNNTGWTNKPLKLKVKRIKIIDNGIEKYVPVATFIQVYYINAGKTKIDYINNLFPIILNSLFDSINKDKDISYKFYPGLKFLDLSETSMRLKGMVRVGVARDRNSRFMFFTEWIDNYSESNQSVIHSVYYDPTIQKSLQLAPEGYASNADPKDINKVGFFNHIRTKENSWNNRYYIRSNQINASSNFALQIKYHLNLYNNTHDSNKFLPECFYHVFMVFSKKIYEDIILLMNNKMNVLRQQSPERFIQTFSTVFMDLSEKTDDNGIKYYESPLFIRYYDNEGNGQEKKIENYTLYSWQGFLFSDSEAAEQENTGLIYELYSPTTIGIATRILRSESINQARSKVMECNALPKIVYENGFDIDVYGQIINSIQDIKKGPEKKENEDFVPIDPSTFTTNPLRPTIARVHTHPNFYNGSNKEKQTSFLSISDLTTVNGLNGNQNHIIAVSEEKAYLALNVNPNQAARIFTNPSGYGQFLELLTKKGLRHETKEEEDLLKTESPKKFQFFDNIWFDVNLRTRNLNSNAPDFYDQVYIAVLDEFIKHVRSLREKDFYQLSHYWETGMEFYVVDLNKPNETAKKFLP